MKSHKLCYHLYSSLNKTFGAHLNFASNLVNFVNEDLKNH